MERKIGEIFEYNDGWYQCIESDSCRCGDCDFDELGDCDNIACTSGERSDDKEVYFKKLEKVGEPYMLEDKKFQKYRVFHTPYIYNKIDYSWQSFADPYYISLEIKEDMEEKKLNLKPFDIQKAREGKPVYTRNGRKARIVCFDRVNAKPILALVRSTDGKGEDVFDYFVSGKRLANALESDLDLMMLPEKREGWVNVYKDGLLDTKSYPTKKEAFDKACPEDYIDTVKINWNE